MQSACTQANAVSFYAWNLFVHLFESMDAANYQSANVAWITSMNGLVVAGKRILLKL